MVQIRNVHDYVWTIHPLFSQTSVLYVYMPSSCPLVLHCNWITRFQRCLLRELKVTSTSGIYRTVLVLRLRGFQFWNPFFRINVAWNQLNRALKLAISYSRNILRECCLKIFTEWTESLTMLADTISSGSSSIISKENVFNIDTTSTFISRSELYQREMAYISASTTVLSSRHALQLLQSAWDHLFQILWYMRCSARNLKQIHR